jgi:tetratricopeptide (TPR) repeat protein
MNKTCKIVCSCFMLLVLSLALGCGAMETRVPVSQEAIRVAKVESTADGIQRAYQDYAFACLAMIDGNYQEAEAYIREALQEDPDSPYLLLKLSQVMAEDGRPEQALSSAQRSVDLAPEDLAARRFLAELYSKLQQFGPAAAQYREILKQDPDNSDARLQLATGFLRSKQYGAALKELSILTEREPGLIIAHYYKGKINLELKNYDEAKGSFLKVLELNARFLPALFDLAATYAAMGSTDRAIETYRRILQLFPTDTAAWERLIALYYQRGEVQLAEKAMNEMKAALGSGDVKRKRLGLIYLRYGKLKESIAELTSIVSAWPDDHEARYYLGAALEENGDLGEAYRNFELLSSESDYFINARIHMAYILEKQEKIDEATDLLRDTIGQRADKPPQLFLVLASLHEMREEYQSAMDVLEEGLGYNGESTELHYRLGVIFGKLKQTEKSIRQMEVVINIDPRHADALNYIGYTYAEENRHLDKAQELIEKAIKYKPNSGYITDSLGWVYFRKGLYDKALTELKKAVELAPDDPAIVEHLGDVYLKKGSYGKALEAYEKAISLKNAETERLERKIEDAKEHLKGVMP